MTRSWSGPGRIRTYDQGIHSAPAFPPGVDYLFTRAPGEPSRKISRGPGRCVWVRDAPSLLSRALQPSGSLCTFRRCTGGSAQGCHGATAEGFPEFIPSTSRVSARRHLIDESPALTAVLQAQPAAIVAAAPSSETKQCAARVAVRAAAVRERLIDRALKPGDLADAAVSASAGVHGAVVGCVCVAVTRCAGRA